MSRWSATLRRLDQLDRHVFPVPRRTDTDEDLYSGAWMHYVERKAVALTLLVSLGGGALAMFAWWAATGWPGSRPLGLVVSTVLMKVMWTRYAKHHYRTPPSGDRGAG